MINQNFKNTFEVLSAFPSEESCLHHLETLRWNGAVRSPFDAFSKVYVCKDNRYRCRNTGKYFNVKTGTIFQNSRIELQKWFVAIWIVSHKPRITSVDLGKDLELTQKTAWYMLRRIKKYFRDANMEIDSLPRKNKAKPIAKPEATEVKPEQDKLQVTEWLKLLKKPTDG